MISLNILQFATLKDAMRKSITYVILPSLLFYDRKDEWTFVPFVRNIIRFLIDRASVARTLDFGKRTSRTKRRWRRLLGARLAALAKPTCPTAGVLCDALANATGQRTLLYASRRTPCSFVNGHRGVSIAAVRDERRANRSRARVGGSIDRGNGRSSLVRPVRFPSRREEPRRRVAETQTRGVRDAAVQLPFPGRVRDS